MAKVQWIKLDVDMFDNRKMKQIECLPEKDGIYVVWLKLLCLAGTINDKGRIYFTKTMPYTEEMLARQFGKEIPLVQLALNTFEQFEMIERDNGMIRIIGWEEHQNIEGMERIKEQNRKRKQKQRAKEKKLPSPDMSRDSHVTSRNREEEIREEENRIDKSSRRSIYDIEKELCVPELTPAAAVYQTLNTCGFSNDEFTKQYTDAWLKTYDPEWIRQAITQAKRRGKVNISYVDGILESYSEQGYVDDGTKEEQIKREQVKQKKKKLEYTEKAEEQITKIEEALGDAFTDDGSGTGGAEEAIGHLKGIYNEA